MVNSSQCPMGSIRSIKKVLEISVRWRAGGGREGEGESGTVPDAFRVRVGK